jgi:hypothetical protein
MSAAFVIWMSVFTILNLIALGVLVWEELSR